MKDLVFVMPTIDRAPLQNYLQQTLANLRRSGLWTSNRLHSLHLVDSGSASSFPYQTAADVDVVVHKASKRRGPAENAAAALAVGAEVGKRWVVFLEDDVDVIHDIAGSIGRWLDGHAVPGPMVYKFTGDHSAMHRPEAVRAGVWQCHITQAWSTVCMAMRPDVAVELSQWLADNPIFAHADGRRDTAYDFEMARWAAMRGISHFICSTPSFCQHLGDASAIRPGDKRVVRFPSWPGRGWSYRTQQQQQEIHT